MTEAELRRALRDLAAERASGMITTSSVVERSVREARRRAGSTRRAAITTGAAVMAVMAVAATLQVVVSGTVTPQTAAVSTSPPTGDLGFAAGAGPGDGDVPAPAPESGGQVAIDTATSAPTPVAPSRSAGASLPSPSPSAEAAVPTQPSSVSSTVSLPAEALVSSTGSAPPVTQVRIDAGGPGSSLFAADTGADGGTSYVLPAATIDLGTSPAGGPMEMYRTVRYGAEFEYRLTGLQPGGQYILRLHWAELDFHAPGDRVFKVLVGDRVVLDGVDVVAEAGAWRRVLIKELPVIADLEGRVVVGFARSGPDNPFISGLELLPT